MIFSEIAFKQKGLAIQNDLKRLPWHRFETIYISEQNSERIWYVVPISQILNFLLVKELTFFILRNWPEKQIPRIIRLFHASRTISFGSLRLSLQGLSVNGCLLQWG